MDHTAIACIILSAGMGTRMKSQLPKVLHKVAGLPMLGHVLNAAATLNPEEMIVVSNPVMPEVGKAALTLDPDVVLAMQDPPQGTGHAVRCAEPFLEGFQGKVLILFGDTPLILPETLQQMAASDAAVTVLGMRPADSAAYGRLICDEATGALQRIVEFNDASEAERAVNLCNSGVMAVDAEDLFRWLSQITNDNAKGEYYLTDIVALAVAEGKRCAVIEAAEASLLGVNDRCQLAEAEASMQQRLRHYWMREGVTMTQPESVVLHHDTELASDVIIEPHVVFGEGVTVASGVHLRAFTHLEGCHIASGAIIGPYARLRPGAQIGKDARIGNFVEIKKAEICQGAKINHLSYVGDAYVGEHANLGAGTITCNYDGFGKYRTSIGAYAFIGSNTALVAPVDIGDGAMIGAGSTITEDVTADSLSMTRPTQLHREAWAAQFRNRKRN